MDSAYDWKQYYAAERSRLGSSALLAMVDEADPFELAAGAAIVVPHTRMEVTGGQIAAAVATVLLSGADRLVALGVLHGARRVDREQVELARSGDAHATAALRGVHDESGVAAEEFSLDGFVELLTAAAAQRGRRIEVVRRYPFLVGDDPGSLPGLTDLEELVATGALLVVTTDPMHHGDAYGTAEPDRLDPALATTVVAARMAIEEQLQALSDVRFEHFEYLVERDRSDFRDTGPVMARLLGPGFESQIHDLALVDYAATLKARSPTWVAGALVTCTPTNHARTAAPR